MSQAPPRHPDEPEFPWRWLPVVAAVLFAGLALHAARVETPTVDEFAHVPAGLAYWEYGRFDLYARNPPLYKLAMAIPLRLAGARVPEPELPAFSGWGPWAYGADFQRANAERYLDLFWLARTLTVGMVLLAGACLYRWARQVFHPRAAAIATTLFFLNPVVLAHGHLATLDAACTVTVFATAFVLRWALVRRSLLLRRSLLRMAAVGSVWGVALLVKFTALLLAPAIVALVALHRWRDGRRGLAEAALVFGAALLVVNLGLGFQGSFEPLGGYQFVSNLGGGLQQLLPGAFPVPVPEVYLVGFDAQLRDTESGELGSYFLGRWSQGGHWIYPWLALAVKIPLPLLGLLVASPWFLRHRRLDRLELWHILAPLISLLFFLTFFNQLGIGIRYLLPAFPLLFLLVAGAWPGQRGWKLPAAFLVHAALLVGMVHPAYLAWFNPLAGGPQGGHRVLADSDLDWGQDLYRLPEALASLEVREPVYLLYFGHVHPSVYGIEYELVPDEPVEGVLAVSANYWLGAAYPATAPDGSLRRIRRGHLDWLRGHEPVLRAGSIWIFDTR